MMLKTKGTEYVDFSMLDDLVKLIRGVPDCAFETGNCHCQLIQHAPAEIMQRNDRVTTDVSMRHNGDMTDSKTNSSPEKL